MKRLIILLITLFTLDSAAFAALSDYGASISIPLTSKDPPRLTGLRASIWYQPPSFVWDRLSLHFDASLADWFVTRSVPNRNITIIAIAPVLRMYFKKTSCVSPYMELSVGPSYMSRTYIDRRNLGMHFAFQDILGVGATLGKEQRLSMSLSAIHYSNGSICSHNSGITIPLLLNVAYKFE